MTDEEYEAAQAAWRALPGTRPDFYSFIPAAEVSQEEIRSSLDRMRGEGATHGRVTEQEDGVWIEGWLIRPHKEAPFDPPFTLAA